jgi:hypothetical protein
MLRPPAPLAADARYVSSRNAVFVCPPAMKRPLWRPAAILVRPLQQHRIPRLGENDSPQGWLPHVSLNEFVAKFTRLLPRL